MYKVRDQKMKQLKVVMTSAAKSKVIKYTFGVKSNRFITGSRGKDTEREMYKVNRNAVHQKQCHLSVSALLIKSSSTRSADICRY